MPGLHKMNHAGLQFLVNLYKKNPNMPFTQMFLVYNDEARRRGWTLLRSSGTIGYHLTVMGLYVKHSRTCLPDPKRGLEIIELSCNARKKIMEAFGVSSANLSLTLRHKRNGKNADSIRRMALELGGIKYTREMTPESKGNVTGVITNNNIRYGKYNK